VSILRKKIEFLREKIDNLEKNAVEAALDSAKKQEQMHREVFDAAKKKAINVNTLGVQYAVLKKEVEINEQLYQILLKKSKEIELNSLIVGNNVSVVDPPSTNPAPVKPNRSLILILGSCFGLLGGVLAALFLEQMDVKVRTAREIEKKLSVPSLGLVPDIRKHKKHERFSPASADFPFLSHDAPTAMVSDAVRNVKTSLLLASPGSTIETMVVASALAGEGKTFIAVSIATAMSSGNKRVLVVDADLRNPSLAGIFGQPSNRPGLANLLAGDGVDLSQVIRRSRVPGLYYIPAGPEPPNPAELLESERLPQIISRFRETFDFVIFDAPPIMGFSDVQLISTNVDGVLLVVQQGRVPMEILQEAKNLVTMTRGRIFGAVLNMTDGVFPHYYGAHRYYYGNYRPK
jgi:polysaccharide biosynthesis transport protein